MVSPLILIQVTYIRVVQVRPPPSEIKTEFFVHYEKFKLVRLVVEKPTLYGAIE